MTAGAALVREAIVVVDDEPVVLRALSHTLTRKLGRRYVIEGASNGAEALELIEELARERTRLRLVVSDAMMPIMDGYALVEWLHLHMPHVPKILVSGYGQEARIERLRQEAGLLAAFSKPWEVEELLAVVEQALAQG